MSEPSILSTQTPKMHHPVLSRLGSRPGSPLTIVDCRVDNLGEQVGEGGRMRAAVEAGTPVLLLQPSAADLGALDGSVGLLPSEPKQAVLIASRVNSAGIREHEVVCLSYPAAPADPEQGGAWSRSGEVAAPAPEGFERVPEESGSAALDAFLGHVEAAIENRRTAGQNDPPTGLKYFRHLYTDLVSFRYRYDPWKVQNRSDGLVKVSWQIWGFLAQSEGTNEQYLAIEASHELQTGLPQWNDYTGRGFGTYRCENDLLASETSTATPLRPVGHVPASGSNSWAADLKVPISYKDPLGGYRIWNFETRVVESLDKYSVVSSGTGNRLGSTWYLHDPVNGRERDNVNWSDAFTWNSHVKAFPHNYIGTLPTKSASVWRAPRIFEGRVDLSETVDHAGGLPYGTLCTGAGCLYAWVCWNWHRNWFSSRVDFSTIVP